MRIAVARTPTVMAAVLAVVGIIVAGCGSTASPSNRRLRPAAGARNRM